MICRPSVLQHFLWGSATFAKPQLQNAGWSQDFITHITPIPSKPLRLALQWSAHYKRSVVKEMNRDPLLKPEAVSEV